MTSPRRSSGPSTEGLSEEELAIFDLLTKPEPVLTDEEREEVKGVAKRLLAHIHEKARARLAAQGGDTADVASPSATSSTSCRPTRIRAWCSTRRCRPSSTTSRPRTATTASVYEEATARSLARRGDRRSAGRRDRRGRGGADQDGCRICGARRAKLRGEAPTFARTIEELIANDEDDAVEFKSTARWDVREQRRSSVMEDSVVKTVAAFLNTDGGTLLIGVAPDRAPFGLELDYAQVKPANGDGFVNWLTQHLINSIGQPAAMRTRARITPWNGVDVCRLDVARRRSPCGRGRARSQRSSSCG